VIKLLSPTRRDLRAVAQKRGNLCIGTAKAVLEIEKLRIRAARTFILQVQESKTSATSKDLHSPPPPS
jgi:hypothetical protein